MLTVKLETVYQVEEGRFVNALVEMFGREYSVDFDGAEFIINRTNGTTYNLAKKWQRAADHKAIENYARAAYADKLTETVTEARF